MSISAVEEDFLPLINATASPESGVYFRAHGGNQQLWYQRTQVCFYGHTHMPVAFIRDPALHGVSYDKLKIESGKQYLVNPGAVGQPRDGNPQTAYIILQSGRRKYDQAPRRLPYDFTVT